MRRITNAEHNKENRASATVGISGIILGREAGPLDVRYGVEA